MRLKKVVFFFPGTLLITSLMGCGGGGDFVANVGGNLSGLTDGKLVALQNNGDEIITLTRNGSFKFGRRLFIDEDYDVRVTNQPSGQECVVSGGSGFINSKSDDINSVSVTCR